MANLEFQLGSAVIHVQLYEWIMVYNLSASGLHLSLWTLLGLFHCLIIITVVCLQKDILNKKHFGTKVLQSIM